VVEVAFAVWWTALAALAGILLRLRTAISTEQDFGAV
jgi:hypothetical protein